MLQGELMLTMFDVTVEQGILNNVSTLENPAPHDEPAILFIAYLKQAEQRVARIVTPLTPEAALNVARDLAKLLDDEQRAELVRQITESRIVVASQLPRA